MTIKVNDAGIWKDAVPYVNDGGVWKAAAEVWVNDAGTWKKAYPEGGGGGTPVFTPPVGFVEVMDQFDVYFTVTSTVPVVWTYTKPPNVAAQYPSGTTATAITFTLSTTGVYKEETVLLYANGEFAWEGHMIANGTA